VSQSAVELAREFGLTNVNSQTSLRAYLRATWARKDFITELADARSTAQYSDSLLGRLWQLITPLLNAAIYYLIFGMLLGTDKGIQNFPAFLIAGVFAFNFIQVSITSAAACIPKNRKLISAIAFPKLVLPLATLVHQLRQYLVALVVLLGIIAVTGEPLTWHWLLLIPVVLLQVLFTTGFSLVVARWGAYSRDITQILPFFLRAWRYISGVFFSISVMAAHLGDIVQQALIYNPGAIFIDILRDCLMDSVSVSPSVWILAVVWSLGTFTFGLVYFFRGETKYA
jgi:teichoic acid transport system permease protein